MANRQSTRSFQKNCRALCVVSLLFVAALSSAFVQAGDVVVLIDGKRLDGSVSAIGEDGKITGTGIGSDIQLSEVREIARDTREQPATKYRVLYLYGGGHLVVSQVTLAEEKCVAVLSTGAELSLPMSAVAGVQVLDDPKHASELRNSDDLRSTVADSKKLGTQDVLYVISKSDDTPKVQPAPGIFERLTNEQVEFVWKDKKRVLSRDKVFGFALAQVKRPPDLAGHVNVSLADGSQVWCRVIQFKDDTLSVRLPTGTNLSLPWSDVVRLDVRNERLVFLSDIEPTQVTSQPLVALPRRWHKNRNVLGQPLQLGKEQFTKGIGVQPRTSLTFDRPDEFDVLAATIGIDAAAKGQGDCEFVVLAGTQELARRRMRGGDEPFVLQVPVAGHKQVTLRVEAGADLDLSDYADWCDVRFIKTSE